MATLLSYALCSVADVKESLGLASSNTQYDNLITRKINQATVMIERFCNRRFAATVYTNEEYDATGIDQLILKNRPVNSLTSFQQRDTSLNEDDWSDIDSELYFTDTVAGVIDLNFIASGRYNRYRVTYNAGYTTIPSDLAEACVTLAAFLVDNGTSGTNVKRKEEGQRTIEFHASQGNSTFEQLGIDEILDSYRTPPFIAK